MQPLETLLTTPKNLEMAVFCDFDGTFVVQDVGSTLARRYAGEARPAAWARYERSEITAWQYNLEILDGLPVPEAALEEFLQTIELDPGAKPLLEWCKQQDTPFRILSDGFDLNLNRLKEIHSMAFDYDANRLWYEKGHWRIQAGYPNDECDCGTGVCKRTRILAYKSHQPNALTVHIGNGRVSDRCGAIAADLAFAKGSLAEELDKRGEKYHPFETLHDVISKLDSLVQSAA